MAFEIRDFIGQLQPDGGRNDPRGDHSFLCPACGANNFKVNIQTGKWAGFGCDCSTTENGKRRIREALSPSKRTKTAKPFRPKSARSWTYENSAGTQLITVHRTDDGNGKRRFRQTTCIQGQSPRDLASKVVPYRLADALQALDDGAPYVFWVEGESCVDACWSVGIPAVTSLGGSKGFRPKRDGDHIPADRLVVCPDRDQPGLTYAQKVASVHHGCRWFIPFPDDPRHPADGGRDIADWLATEGVDVGAVLAGVQTEAPQFNNNAPSPEQLTPLDQWEQLLQHLVDPEHPAFERNPVRRHIEAATAAQKFRIRVSPDQISKRIRELQRQRIRGTAERGVSGGCRVRNLQKQWLINELIAQNCLTAIAAFAKVGKTKLLCELAACLVFQRPFMGHPAWQPAPGPHRLILWWTDQPEVDTNAYLRAVGLIDSDGRYHPAIVKVFTQEDGLCWDEEGHDELIKLTTQHPGAVLLSDSFFRNIQPIYGDDQDPGAGGALIELQSMVGASLKAHICAFHSPADTSQIGIAAIRGHGSAKGVPSAGISLHFLQKRCPHTNKLVADKENHHRRMVMEGRGPYLDLMIRGDWAAGTFKVLGEFNKALAALTADDRKAAVLAGLTEKQRKALELVSEASDVSKNPKGVTAYEVATLAVADNEEPTESAIESMRQRLKSLAGKEILRSSKDGRTERFRFRDS